MEDRGTPILRPMDLLDLLDEVFRTYRSRFTIFATNAAITALPGIALALGVGSYQVFGLWTSMIQHPTSPPSDFNSLGLHPGLSLLQYPVGLALLPLNIGLPVATTVQHLLGGRPTVASVWRATLRLYGPLLGFGVVLLVAVLSPIFCLIGIPLAFWIGPKLAAGAAVMFVEGGGVGRALNRSWHLSQGAWTRVFGALFLGILLTEAVEIAIVPVPMVAVFLLPLGVNLQGALELTLVSLAGQLAAPLLGITSALIYLDLRVRREALDLQQMAVQELAAPAT